MNGEITEQPKAGLRAMPGGVWALGFVSLFMDISSEMIHGLLPVFLTSVLGASTEMVGLIEGRDGGVHHVAEERWCPRWRWGLGVRKAR
jgi:hypothetical protein